MDRYYVDLTKVRTAKAIAGVNARLMTLEAGEYATLLFTGHRGCGKSTELRRIQDQWSEQYRIVYLEADAILDINNTEYVDLYLAIIKQIADDLTTLQLKFDAELLQSFEKWFKEVTNETEKTVEGSIATEIEAKAGFEVPFISKLLTKVLAQLKNSSVQRETIRDQLKRDISRLQSDVNLLLSDAHRKLTQEYPDYKGFLIIVDNLDRVSVNVAKHLYFDFGTQLQNLNCTIIYTVPINVIYPNHGDAQNSGLKLSSIFESPNIMPMINIYQYEPTRCELDFNPEALEAMASLIRQRVMVVEVLEDEADLQTLAIASGGHVRQLMQLFRAVCLSAIGEGRDRLSAGDIDYAIKQAQFEFERLIPRDQYKTIAQVCLKKDFEDDSVRASLLHNTAVLEYNGTTRWNYPNPVVKKSEAFIQALKTIQNSGT